MKHIRALTIGKAQTADPTDEFLARILDFVTGYISRKKTGLDWGI